MQIVYKVVMIGDFGVGKTSLVQRFINNSFSEEYLSTIGVSIAKKTTEHSTIMLWDIEGHTEFKPIFKQYLLGAKGFILVGDMTRIDTIKALQHHIELCHGIVPDVPIVIALNKADIENIENAEVLQQVEKISSHIVKVLKTSAKSGEHVEELFHALDKAVIEGL
jgi:small GTP-binding protein